MTMNLTVKHLFQRGSNWQFRRRVPDDVREAVGKREWTKSLGAVAQDRAIELARRQTAITDQEIISARAKAGQNVSFEAEVAIEDEAFFRTVKKYGGIEATSRALGSDRQAAIDEGLTQRERNLLANKTMFSSAFERDQALYPVSFKKHQEIGFENFIRVNGDVAIDEISRDQVMAYVADCRARGHAETSIKRRLGALGAVVNRYYQDHDITRRNPFHRVPLKGGGATKEDRVPIDEEQVVAFDTYLREATGLRPRTLGLLWLVRSSSLGPSEAAGLEPGDIVLEHEVPHVVVRPNSLRDLKVKSRQRLFPLVGEVLEHVRGIPGGAFNPNATSALINKHLRRAVELRPKQSAYSFRHRMKDRLYAAGATRDQALYLMGHSSASAHDRYGGAQPSLCELRDLVSGAL
ncbi:MAG: DUF6538 domain-containing protein [Pseudomonadota bacterium]